VRSTLGPRGRNAVLDKGWGSPKITKDGVTVAENVELDDPYENLGAQLVKEAASKTNDVAGDGTTTATVLAEAIFKEGLKMIAAGADPMALARGIGKGTVETLERLALETGLSLWGAIGEAIRRQLLPQRAVASLKNFQQLIEDARAMQAGTFEEQLDQSAAPAQEGTTDGSASNLPSPAGTEYESPGRKSRVQVEDGTSPARDGTAIDGATAFDPSEFGNISFDFATIAPEHSAASGSLDSAGTLASERSTSARDDNSIAADDIDAHSTNAFPVRSVSTADILKFLIDRTGYIKLLEEEDTPEAYSRIENLRELVNAAMDSRDRGETLDQFLDHAALISDADAYDERAQISLMSLHSAKGLEFPLVFLSGLEEGLFPHSRTMLVPDDIEEERRLCYVGMTRAMDQLILTRAVYRRRYGTDLPEASVPSRFLEEVPGELIEDLGRPRASAGRVGMSTGRVGRTLLSAQSRSDDTRSPHYSYEDEDQSAVWRSGGRDSHVSQNRRDPSAGSGQAMGHPNPAKPTPAARSYNSIENIAEFFASRGRKFTLPKTPVEEPTGKRGFRPGQKVRHPKYGEGTVYQREGEGEEAKITVQFPRFGLKKLVEKYAQLERA